MKIEKIVKSQRSKDSYWLHFDDGSKLKTFTANMAAFGLYKGMELTEAQLEALLDASKTEGAKLRAVRLTGLRPLNKRELQRKLTEKGERPEDAQLAADWLEAQGAIDEADYALAVARRYAGRGYGSGRVREELRRRGVPKEHWDAALDSLPPAAETLDHLLETKLGGAPVDAAETNRVANGLYRRGFSWEEIRSALRRYEEAHPNL